jgi:pimeloyl-ACP methyl ester carboxylesterase
MSSDLPFHAEGPRRDQFNDRDFLMKWIDEVLKPARESGKPIYLVGHSFGPEIIGEYLYHNPHAVAGAALLSPVGFNATLRAWEKNQTSHMEFGGGDVADNTLGGLWADRVGKLFKWTKSEGKGDPTLENPNLRVEILSGDREEYVPAPTGGKNGLPIGRNTYDIASAIRPFLRRANIVIEPGVGHMIFGHKDENGQDIVSRTIFQMLNVDGRREGQMAQELAELRNGRPQWVQLETMLAQNALFQSWLAATNQTGLARGLIRTANNELSFKLMSAFREALRERMKQVKR